MSVTGTGTPSFESGSYYQFDETASATASATCLSTYPLGHYLGWGTGSSSGDLSTSNYASAPPPASPPASNAGPHTWTTYVSGDSFAQVGGGWLALCPSTCSLDLIANATSGDVYTDGASGAATSTCSNDNFDVTVDWGP